MKTYKVTISGVQSHIKGDVFESQTESQVESIINKYWDEDYPKPKYDGNNWELNGDQNICIEEIIEDDLDQEIKVDKTDFEIEVTISGCHCIDGYINGEPVTVWGGDPACEDHFNEDFAKSVLEDWDGTLYYDTTYGYQINQ